MEIKICRSHVTIYEFLKKKAKATISNCFLITHREIVANTGLSHPKVVKCMLELAKGGYIKKLKDGRGRLVGGSQYMVDTSYSVVKTKQVKERIYKQKYSITVLELKQKDPRSD